MDINDKLQNLCEQVGRFKKVAVAFSGGVDSSLLLSVCVEVLGPQNVHGLFGLSCLQSAAVIENAKDNFTWISGQTSTLHFIELFPLDISEFILNDEKRCYYCKRSSYAVFVKLLTKLDCDVLFDGTNADDLNDHRPGFQAIQEHGVITPLSNAGLGKHEIRKLARQRGLKNHDLPSNSCLATRIPTHSRIHKSTLSKVEQAETILNGHGFRGCRVRLFADKVVLELQNSDFKLLADHKIRKKIFTQLGTLGLQTIHLDLQGRNG